VTLGEAIKYCLENYGILLNNIKYEITNLAILYFFRLFAIENINNYGEEIFSPKINI